MSTILITGTKGFLGQNVASYFSENGWEVIGIGHGHFSLEEMKKYGLSEWYEGDITMDLLCSIKKNIDIVLHCAGGSSVSIAQNEPELDFLKTVLSISNLLRYISIYQRHALVIYPSSAAVYGNSKSNYISEEAPLNYLSFYGLHKKISEDICIFYSRYFGIRVKIIRFFSLYGDGLKKQLLWDTCQKIISKNYHFTGSGFEKRDWLHVTDAARLIYLIGNSNRDEFEILNGGTGVGHTTSYVINRIFNLFELTKKPIFSKSKIESDPNKLIANVSKIQSYCLFPLVSLDKGISSYVDWFKRQLHD